MISQSNTRTSGKSVAEVKLRITFMTAAFEKITADHEMQE